MGDDMDFRCIVLVEVLRKSTTGIIIQRLTKAIQYHYSQAGFQMGRGMGTTTLEAKLLHNVYHDGGVPSPYFLDLHKFYWALYWDRCLNILAGYGMVPRTIWLLKT